MSRIKYCFCICLLVIASTIFSGCAVLNFLKPEVQDLKAMHIVKELQNRNRTLKTSKGTGWITLAGNKKTQKFRMAWAASFPDKIRITLLSAGHPMETIAADGNKLTIVSHTGSHPPHTINSSNPSLKHIISIPVTIQDIITLLCGRIPLGEFDSAHFFSLPKPADTNIRPENPFKIDTTGTEGQKGTAHNLKLQSCQMLILKKKWSGKTRKLFMDDAWNVFGLYIMDQDKTPCLSVLYDEYSQFNEFTIPSKININERSGFRMNLEITGYQANIPIKQSVFTLTDQR